MFVINYDLSNEPETYVHRIGRTGRAGNEWVALSFCDEEEYEYLLDIEKLTGQKIRRMENHPYHINITAPLSKAQKKQKNREKEERKRGYMKEARERKNQWWYRGRR